MGVTAGAAAAAPSNEAPLSRLMNLSLKISIELRGVGSAPAQTAPGAMNSCANLRQIAH
jgi:hypothetical protein